MLVDHDGGNFLRVRRADPKIRCPHMNRNALSMDKIKRGCGFVHGRIPVHRFLKNHQPKNRMIFLG